MFVRVSGIGDGVQGMMYRTFFADTVPLGLFVTISHCGVSLLDSILGLGGHVDQ